MNFQILNSAFCYQSCSTHLNLNLQFFCVLSQFELMVQLILPLQMSPLPLICQSLVEALQQRRRSGKQLRFGGGSLQLELDNQHRFFSRTIFCIQLQVLLQTFRRLRVSSESDWCGRLQTGVLTFSVLAWSYQRFSFQFYRQIRDARVSYVPAQSLSYFWKCVRCCHSQSNSIPCHTHLQFYTCVSTLFASGVECSQLCGSQLKLHNSFFGLLFSWRTSHIAWSYWFWSLNCV